MVDRIFSHPGGLLLRGYLIDDGYAELSLWRVSIIFWVKDLKKILKYRFKPQKIAIKILVFQWVMYFGHKKCVPC
jgi:hypothetical protein